MAIPVINHVILKVIIASDLKCLSVITSTVLIVRGRLSTVCTRDSQEFITYVHFITLFTLSWAALSYCKHKQDTKPDNSHFVFCFFVSGSVLDKWNKKNRSVRRRAEHLQLFSEVTNFTVLWWKLQCAAWNQITVWWKMAT